MAEVETRSFFFFVICEWLFHESEKKNDQICRLIREQKVFGGKFSFLISKRQNMFRR